MTSLFTLVSTKKKKKKKKKKKNGRKGKEMTAEQKEIVMTLLNDGICKEILQK